MCKKNKSAVGFRDNRKTRGQVWKCGEGVLEEGPVGTAKAHRQTNETSK